MSRLEPRGCGATPGVPISPRGRGTASAQPSGSRFSPRGRGATPGSRLAQWAWHVPRGSNWLKGVGHGPASLDWHQVGRSATPEVQIGPRGLAQPRGSDWPKGAWRSRVSPDWLKGAWRGPVGTAWHQGVVARLWGSRLVQKGMAGSRSAKGAWLSPVVPDWHQGGRGTTTGSGCNSFDYYTTPVSWLITCLAHSYRSKSGHRWHLQRLNPAHCYSTSSYTMRDNDSNCDDNQQPHHYNKTRTQQEC